MTVSHLPVHCAMGKSGSFPLPCGCRIRGSPTPISALIPAATMVTAGIFRSRECRPVRTFDSRCVSSSSRSRFLYGILVSGRTTSSARCVLNVVTARYMTVALGVLRMRGLSHLITHAFSSPAFSWQRVRLIAMHHDRIFATWASVEEERDVITADRVAGADRRSFFLWLLFERLDHHCDACCSERGAMGRVGRVLGADCRCVHYRVLFVPDVLPRFSRQAALG